MLNNRSELVPRPSKNILIAQELQQKNDQYSFKTTSTSRSSLKNVDHLEKVFLKDLSINRIHYGKYLICRTVEETFYADEIFKLIIEDELGEVENIFLSDLISMENFQINSIFIIKEPYCIMKDKECFIKIESPTDIQMVFNHDIAKWQSKDSFLSADQLNLLGNQSFSNKDFHSAVKFYTWALDKKKEAKIFGNRAAAFLNLNYFYESSKDCKISIEMNSKNEKAFFRLAKCCYQMKQFAQALEALENCLSINSENAEAKKELDRTKKRLIEAKTGEYEFKNLIEACRDKVLRHDIADFVSDKIYLDKEKRIFKAKTSIKRGTLILCEKAASICYKTENMVQSKAPKMENFKLLINQLVHNPFLLQEVNELAWHKDTLVEQNFCIDVARIKDIVDRNSFQSRPVEFCSNFKPEPNQLESNSGLWIKSAFIQHSCLPNVQKICFNDVVFIYASQDINENEQITTSYVNNTQTYQERSTSLAEYGITRCDCKLCRMDREDELTSERDSYVIANKERILKLVDQDSKDVNQGLDYFNNIKDMYKNRTNHKLCLAPALLFCASLFRNKGKLNKSAKIYVEMFELCKDYQYDLAVYGLVEALNDFFLCFDMENAKECFKKLKEYSVGHQEYFMHVCDAKIIDYENIHQLLN